MALAKSARLGLGLPNLVQVPSLPPTTNCVHFSGTRSAVFSLMTSSSLVQGCLYEIIDHTLPAIPSMRIYLRATSASTLEQFCAIQTSLATTAWWGRYDIVSNRIWELHDDRGNVVIDTIGTTGVLNFPWGSPSWVHNYLENVVLSAGGGSGIRAENKVVNANIDVSGFSGSLVRCRVSGGTVNLASASGAVVDVDVVGSGNLNASGAVSVTMNRVSIRNQSSVAVAGRTAATLLQNVDLEAASNIFAVSSTGPLSLNGVSMAQSNLTKNNTSGSTTIASTTITGASSIAHTGPGSLQVTNSALVRSTVALTSSGSVTVLGATITASVIDNTGAGTMNVSNVGMDGGCTVSSATTAAASTLTVSTARMGGGSSVTITGSSSGSAAVLQSTLSDTSSITVNGPRSVNLVLSNVGAGSNITVSGSNAQNDTLSRLACLGSTVTMNLTSTVNHTLQQIHLANSSLSVSGLFTGNFQRVSVTNGTYNASNVTNATDICILGGVYNHAGGATNRLVKAGGALANAGFNVNDVFWMHETAQTFTAANAARGRYRGTATGPNTI